MYVCVFPHRTASRTVTGVGYNWVLWLTEVITRLAIVWNKLSNSALLSGVSAAIGTSWVKCSFAVTCCTLLRCRRHHCFAFASYASTGLNHADLLACTLDCVMLKGRGVPAWVPSHWAVSPLFHALLPLVPMFDATIQSLQHLSMSDSIDCGERCVFTLLVVNAWRCCCPTALPLASVSVVFDACM